MANQNFVATAPNGKKYKFSVPEGVDPTPDQLFAFVMETFPNDFKPQIDKYQKDYLKNTDTGKPARLAREYWASKDKENFDFKGLSPIGIGAIKQYGKSAAIAREAEKSVRPLDIRGYRERYLDPDAREPEATPGRILQAYRLSPNRSTFVFPKGFSAVGRAAIRQIVAEEDKQRAAESRAEDIATKSAIPVPGTFGPLPDVMTPAQIAGTIRGLRRLDILATSAVTGQKPGEAPAFGFDPYGASVPGRGFGETVRREVSQLARPSVAAPLIASAPLAAGALTGIAAVPAVGPMLAGLGTLAGTLPVAEAAGRGSVTGDYREAAGLAALNLGAEAIGGAGYLGLTGMRSLRGSLISRLANRAGQIGELEARMTPPAADRARRPLVQPPAETIPTPTVAPAVPPAAPAIERVPRRLAPALPEERVEVGRRPYAPMRRVRGDGAKPWEIEPSPGAVATVVEPPAGAGTAPFTPEELATRRPLTRGVDTLSEDLKILVSRRDRQIREYGTVAPDLEDAILSVVSKIEQQGGQVPFEYRRGLPIPRGKKKVTQAEEAPEPTAPTIAPEPVATAPELPATTPEVAAPATAPVVPPATLSVPRPRTARTTAGVPPPVTPEQLAVINDVESELNRALGIRQAAQRQEAINLGVVESIPPQGSTSAVSRADIERVVADPEYRAELMERLDNIDWNDAESYKGLSTAEQTAAWIRQRELTPDLNSPVESVRRGALQEWIRLHQAIYKIGSQKGFELAMQRLFNSVIDFSKPEVSNDVRSFIASTMRNAGATDDQIELAINKVLPRANQGILENANAQRRVDDAADIASQVIADAKQRGKRATDDDILQEYRRRLAAIDKTQAERWGQKSVYVAPVVREFRNGVRRLEQVKARIKELYGEDLSDDAINDIMRQARVEFELDQKKIDQIVQGINTSVRREVWNTYSGTRRAIQRLKNFQNFERMLVLGLDLGIFGVQFGLPQATRPGFLIGELPQTTQRTAAERALASTIGGVPSKKFGTIGATLRSFGSERGAAEAAQDIETLARVRYSEFDDPFGEAGLMGFRQQDRDLGGLSGEVSYDTAAALEDIRKIPIVGRLTGKMYESSQRATETGLRYGRALLFDQMMSPFENLKGDQKMQAMQAVASFVNSVTGGGTYNQSVENALKLLGNVQTAPRYYMSNIEMATVISPLARTLQKSKGLPAKERAKLAKMVGMEYGRMVSMMTTMKLLLEPSGMEVVSDPFDPDFGTVRYSLTEGAEGTFNLLGGREKYVPLILSMSGFKRERPAAGISPQWKRLTAGDRAQAIANTLYGKSTFIPRTVASLIPSKLPEEVRFLGPSVETLSRSEFRAPGGTAFIPAETMNAPGGTLMYFGQMIPAALFAKQIAQNLPTYVGNGNTESGKRVIELARTGGALASLSGYGSNVKLKPEMVQFVMSDQGIAKLPPAIRDRIRTNILSGKPVSSADQRTAMQAMGGK